MNKYLFAIDADIESAKPLLDAMESARDALADLGACMDANCTMPNCNHAYSKIVNMIEVTKTVVTTPVVNAHQLHTLANAVCNNG
jgi:hypothetical protein